MLSTRNRILNLPLRCERRRLASFQAGSVRRSVKTLLNREIPCLYIVGGVTSGRFSRSEFRGLCDADDHLPLRRSAMVVGKACQWHMALFVWGLS